MKVVVFKNDMMGKLYGKKYDMQFFYNLWKECLEDREEIDEVIYHDYVYTVDDLAYVCKDVDAAVGMWINNDLITRELLERCPKTKYFSTAAHGYGRFDLDATHEHNVTLTNTIYGDVTIAQYAMGMLLDLCHNVTRHSDNYKNERFTNPNYSQIIHPQIELFEKTIGIIGLGSIGLKFAEMARGFGMNVIAYSRSKNTDPNYAFIEQVSFDEVLAKSDFISIHCPLTEDTKHLINDDAISKMKDDVIIINTARGDIIDEEALYNALKSGKVLGAGLDVVSGEPLQAPCKLMECENVKITAHIAWLTIESRVRGVRMMSDNLINWIHGNPTYVINK
ncbi:MAG: NAD(P)-dependent oxidoreductase [Clostridia bacterium]